MSAQAYAIAGMFLILLSIALVVPSLWERAAEALRELHERQDREDAAVFDPPTRKDP